MGISALVEFALLSTVLTFVPADIRPVVNWILLIGGTLSILIPFTLIDSLQDLLPPVEDRVLHFLDPALVSLKAYVSNGNEDDRKKALKKLKEISAVLDVWDTGNLKFVKDTIGETVKDFKKNFDGRVIPALKQNDRDRIRLLQMFLSQVVRPTLENGQLTELHINGWNTNLTMRRNPEDPAQLFPYFEPSPSRLSWLRSKWFHLLFWVALPVAPALVYSVTVTAQLASRDAAFGGAIAVLVAMIGAYVAFMTLGRKRG